MQLLKQVEETLPISVRSEIGISLFVLATHGGCGGVGVGWVSTPGFKKIKINRNGLSECLGLERDKMAVHSPSPQTERLNSACGVITLY